MNSRRRNRPTTLLYHAFGLQGYDYVHQFFVAGNVVFWVKPKPKFVNGSTPGVLAHRAEETVEMWERVDVAHGSERRG